MAIETTPDRAVRKTLAVLAFQVLDDLGQSNGYLAEISAGISSA